jgi:Undecaprenyl-phosphate glucose phosphotransferase
LSRKTQDAILILRVLSDMTMVTLAWALAYYARFSGLLPVDKGIPEPLLYFKLVPFILAIWFVVLGGSGFYRRTGRHRSAFVEALDILQSCFFATLAFIAFTYVYEEYRYSRLTMAIFALVHPWMIIAGRSVIRKALRRYRRRATPRRTLIIGSGECLRHALELGPMDDLARGEIAGVILVGDAERIADSRRLCAERGLTVFEPPADWPAFLSQHPTHAVVIALPHRAYDFLDTELEKIADQVPDVRLIPDLVRYTRFAAGIDVVGGTPVVTINESPLAGMGSVVKRLVDIGGAVFGLLLFGPVMIAIALVVRLSSKGPVLYKQERMGLDGRTFQTLKFRSMPVDSEAKTGAVWATAGDDRATPFGRMLRRSSLDELPQLFNILRGEMSLVGPRPERPVFVEQFRRSVPGYYLRHKVKAGLTGWAQVNGWRGNTSIEKRIECDLFYIQNWSLWFDLRIIFLTIFRGFIHKNAY